MGGVLGSVWGWGVGGLRVRGVVGGMHGTCMALLHSTARQLQLHNTFPNSCRLVLAARAMYVV